MLYQVVRYERGTLDAVFGALADPTRRAITRRLARGPASVTELAEPFDVTLPAILKHLAVLENAGLVAQQKVGRTKYCSLVPERLESAAEWIDGYREFWRARFDSLHRYLQEEQDT